MEQSAGKQIAVLFGGVSSEHEVSLISASSVINNIPDEKYTVYPVGITREGKWFLYSGDLGRLPEDTWEEDGGNVPAAILPDRSAKGLTVYYEDGARLIPLDAVFPVLHGKNGEDGTIQGLLAMCGLPCVGCGTLSSAMCMDKAVTNAMADLNGIPQAKWLTFTEYDYKRSAAELERRVGDELGYPCFVKPANAGSSVGISKATDAQTFRAACELAFKHDRKLVVEEAVVGKEIECAVLGNDEPIASTVGEIVPNSEFYDYEAKYISTASKLHIPARLSDEVAARVQRQALRAYKALDCTGLSRVDFFVRDNGDILFNEINTMPGFTSISMYPKLFAASGIPYPELLDRLITLAIERACENG